MKIIQSYFNILLITVFFACSSQEYTTAKLALQQSDFKKAAEWLPKAMAVEPDNPEIPIVMAIEIHAENEKWSDMIKLLNRAMDINPDKVIEIRGSFIPVKDAVNNYVEFYWAKEFNAGVEQFKKIQNDPDKKNQYLDVAINHFTNAVGTSSCNNIVIWLVLLQHLPLHFNVVSCESPIAFCINVADVQTLIESMLNSGSHHGYLSGNELKTTAWTFVIEEDTCTRKHVVGFTVIASDLKSHHFSTPIRRARMEWSLLRLRYFTHFSVLFARTCLVESALRSMLSNSLEASKCTKPRDISGHHW